MGDRLSWVQLPKMSWVRRASHRRWLGEEGMRLLRFSSQSKTRDGFAALNHDGHLPSGSAADGTLTARMVHSYALAAIQGIPGCRSLAQHGVDALLGPLYDQQHGGWLERAPAETEKEKEAPRKQAYFHAFVGLAASSAQSAQIEGGSELLSRAVKIIEQHFWDDDEGVMRESFASDWSGTEAYWGANANMHTTETFLALADVTGENKWLDRALRIVSKFVHELATSNDFCMPEHFDLQWNQLRDYNKDKPTDPLRPYGMTPGHFAEWAHLTLKLEAALLRQRGDAPGWVLQGAKGLFASAMTYGWSSDGQPGIVYTINWDHTCHVPVRAHWVHAEAVTAAITLLKRTGHSDYESWYRRLWDYITEAFIDDQRGGWKNEVDKNGKLSKVIYPDKADLYHAYQATLSPLLPLSPCLSQSLK